MTGMQSIPLPSTKDDVCDLVAFIEAMIGEGVDAVELGPSDALLCVAALRAFRQRASEIQSASHNHSQVSNLVRTKTERIKQ